MEFEVLQHVLAVLTAHYKKPHSWETPPTIPLTWYWEILDRMCQLVKPSVRSLDLTWCHEAQMAVPLLAQVYSAFSEAFSYTLLQCIPNAVKQCRNDHMRRYFEWVQGIQQFILSWRKKIIDQDVTEEEILEYANMTIPLHKIVVSLHIEALEVHAENVTSLKTILQKLKLLVNGTLIRIDSNGRR